LFCNLEQFQPFPADAELENNKSGGVAARPRQAFDEAAADRVGDIHEHNWHGTGRLLQRQHGRAADGQDNVRPGRDQFRCVPASTVRIGPSPASVDPHVAADGPPELLEPVATRACPSGSCSARFMSTPIRRIRSGCCARAASGHAAAPLSAATNSRRPMLTGMVPLSARGRCLVRGTIPRREQAVFTFGRTGMPVVRRNCTDRLGS
jgi:hypothetical protein